MPPTSQSQNLEPKDFLEIGGSPVPGITLRQVLRGHTNRIGRMAWSPDGVYIASPSADQTIRIWDVRAGHCVRTLQGHTDEVFSVAWSPDGHVLASGSSDMTICIWNTETWEILAVLEGHEGGVLSMAWSSDGHELASGSHDMTIRIWDATNRFIEARQPPIVLGSHKNSVTSIAWSPDGRRLASTSLDGTVRIWDPKGGFSNLTLVGHAGWVIYAAWQPTRRIVASGGHDGIILLWEEQFDHPIRRLEGHTSSIRHLSFSPNGFLLASRGGDSIRLWRTDTWEALSKLDETTIDDLSTGHLAFHPRLPILATLGENDTIIRIWEVEEAILLSQAVPPTVTYTSAKIVLVGESNVGKSYLAHRIATGKPPREGTIKTTHGMKFWPLAPEQLCATTKTPKDQRRDVVLWDMGGQEEYRLIHQLFLHDTTVALVLLDPTRGATAFKEAETWNKYLDKQLAGRQAVKLLVGAKLDQPSATIDQQALARLRAECGFAGYYETSALTGRGVAEVCEAIAAAIDWDGLAKTSRPELFQRIRDEIEARRKQGEVVLHVAALHRALGNQPPTQEAEGAVNAVTEQLATQGVIARSRVSTGEPVLVLQVQEIERYAGSLIMAARNNPRGVPALELRAIGQSDFPLPGIAERDLLPRGQERPVLECTVQLMLEHGICFQHEGLLIFPSLFAATPEATAATLPHAVSLYYDFAGAIDNIYASLIAWLVLAQDFGRVRLWAERAEFEIQDGGFCGLRKVARPGGFAHMDVYFEANTPERRRHQFISFVEDHLSHNGVEIREHVALTCACGNQLPEETLRQRIARGDKDVVCPVCETRHSLAEGATETRERDPQISQHTWALRTELEKRRQKTTEEAVRVVQATPDSKPATVVLRLLHLSDLHLTGATPIQAQLQWLLDDIKQDGGLGFQTLDYLVISGDFTDKGSIEGFEKAYEFVSGLAQAFELSAERCIFVPGNHDVRDLREAYEWREKADGLKEGEWVRQGEIVLARNSEKYPLRLKAFSESFYHKFLQRPYPLEAAAQGIAIPFWETGIQFLALNSCWQIDQFHRKRAGLHPEAVAHAVREAQQQEAEARKTGQLAAGQPLLRIAAWHHAVTAPDFKMTDVDFLGHLQNNGVKIGLHGDVHEMHHDLIGYWREAKKLHIIASGSFGAAPADRPESTPRLYNLLEIARDFSSVRVHTRCQPKRDGPWDGWYEWPDPDGGKGRLPYYDITW